MADSIQARLDDESAAVRDELKRQLGWSDSDIVRRGIMALEGLIPRRKRRFVGLGKYDTGIPDLSTNLKYMEGFGES